MEHKREDEIILNNFNNNKYDVNSLLEFGDYDYDCDSHDFKLEEYSDYLLNNVIVSNSYFSYDDMGLITTKNYNNKSK
jgi:hypothetical protein